LFNPSLHFALLGLVSCLNLFDKKYLAQIFEFLLEDAIPGVPQLSLISAICDSI